MDQGVRYVVTLSDINVTSGLKSMEGSAVSAERSIASLNSTLAGLAGSLGIGLGLKQIFTEAKEAVQGAADYEAAIKRIRFASDSLADGAKNIAFIRSEVDKFKIPLLETTDAYGKFLAMLTGSGIGGDQVRKLHDELLLIGKVKGLGAGQLDAAVMNLGKMLESGSLDARHFRPLEQQLSGIGAFVAKELGITVHQLAILRNQGKMTTIDPKVLLTAIEKQAASLQGFLPESLTTIQSNINDLNKDWLEFKNNLVFDNLPELKALFATLKDGVAYLKEHEATIVSTGKTLYEVGKIWLTYKGVMALANIAASTYAGFMSGFLGESTAVISATELRAAAMNTLALSMERVAYASELMAGASLSGAVGLGALGIPLQSAGTGVIAAEAGAGGAMVAGAKGLGMSVIKGGLAVFIVGSVLDTLFPTPDAPNGDKLGFFHPFNTFKDGLRRSADIRRMEDAGYVNVNKRTGEDPEWVLKSEQERMTALANAIPRRRPGVAEGDYLKMLENMGFKRTDTTRNIFGEEGTNPAFLPKMREYNRGTGVGAEDGLNDALLKKYGLKPTAAGKTTEKYIPPNDHVTGQRVVTYNINIKEINGIKQNTVNEGGKMDTTDVAVELRDIIVSIVNDSQIQGGY